MNPVARAAVAATVIASMCACSGSSATMPPASVTSLTVSPDSLSLGVGDASSLSAVAHGDSNQVVAGLAVTWSSTAPSVATVSGSGMVSAAATGSAMIVATAGGHSDSARVSVHAAAAGGISKVSGDAQRATLGSLLPAALVVKVTDAHGAPVANASVAWSAGDGSGSVSPSATPTNSQGLAQTRWTIGATFLGNTAAATAAGHSVSFSALGDGSGSLGGRVAFPSASAWNADVSASPVDPLSDTLIANCGASRVLHPDFGTTYAGAPNGIPYVVVHGSQSKVPVSFDYSDESDPGPYPVPTYAPIEGGPSSSGDRHVLVIDWDHWKLYEMYAAYPQGSGTSWTAGSGAIFDLTNGTTRPAGWTSADAAGLPIFPGLVRYDEVGALHTIAHALRFTCPRSQRAYVAPASHWASSSTDSTLPPMGMRVRLKSSVDISGFSPAVQVILRALKKYGMFMADNGSGFFLSGAPDPRWSDDDLHTLQQLHGSDFEVVKMVGVVR